MTPGPKPLPLGRTRLRCSCICGKRVPSGAGLELLDPVPCKECGSIQRMWERIPNGPIARFKAWYLLRKWKQRRTL
jgi:hypothetical protein